MTSRELERFADTYGFRHKTSSPYHQSGNGLAEKAVDTCKRMMTKCMEDKSDFQLLNYRNTPTEGLSTSPAQRLMNRRTRTTLPTTTLLLKPEVINEEKERVTRKEI